MTFKYLLSALFVAICFYLEASTPKWVKTHPINEFGYAGVGMAKTTEKDYMNLAKNRALADLASGISINISSSSLLNMIEDNGEIQEYFEETIHTNISTYLGKYRLVDTWNNNDEYWVYYELNSLDYNEYIENKRQKAMSDGLSLWKKGQTMINEGNIISGSQLLIKAWESITPVLYMDLTCIDEKGEQINLGTTIYSSIIDIYNGITISVDNTEFHGRAFEGIKDAVSINVQRNNQPIKNIEIQAKFVRGEGAISQISPTNEYGKSYFYIHNITSKIPKQEIEVSIDLGLSKHLSNSQFKELFKKQDSTMPKAIINIFLDKKDVTAYIKETDSALKAIKSNICNMLTKQYFTITKTPENADLTIAIKNDFVKGNKVAGELYNMVEYFANISINITNNATQKAILNYSIDDVRVLVPENKSKPQAEAMISRELLKLIKKEFPKELQNLSIK